MTPASASTTPTAAVAERLRRLLLSVQDRQARTAADRELARRLRAAVEGARLEVYGLSFYVHEGSIAVYGLIRTEALRERVLTLVAEQPGARRIHDHLHLPPA